MGGKARVHELAKELGVTAKDVLARLSEQGQFVKSASSTVEAPVARRLRESYRAKPRRAGSRGADVKSRVSANPVTTRPVNPTAPRAGGSLSGRRLTPSESASVCRRFRQACASGQDEAAINRLYSECEAQYLVSRQALLDAVEEDFARHPGKYVARRPSRKGDGRTPPFAGRSRDDASADTSGSAIRPGEVSCPRPRTDSLPPHVDVVNTESVVDLILNIDASQDNRDEIRACMADFIPDGTGGYGYLAWRYSAAHRRTYTDSSSRTVHHDLAVMAQVVDTQTLLVSQIISAHGPVLEQPALAKRVLDAKFSDLIDVDDIGRSAADEQRHVRAGLDFLRLAVVLVIASPDCDQRLWNMLDRIRPPAPDQLVETNALLESAIARLNELIYDVETLLRADEVPLGQFFRRAHTELVALHAGRYDFLRQFRDIASTVGPPRRANEGLPFAILPRGEQLRTFLDGLRSSGRYRGRQVDVQRVTVLEDIEKYFGADRCQWHEGAASSSGFDNDYVVLTIKTANDVGDHAVAISPLAGEHATYVVREDCAQADWMTVLAQSKSEAREQGACSFHFTGSDPYNDMRAKVIDALECPRQEFLKRLAAASNNRRDRQP